MQYLCLAYFDHAIIDPSQTGTVLAGLRQLHEPAIIRVWNGCLDVVDGPAEANRETLGAFSIINARDLNDAVRLASTMPAAQIARIEVRPIDDFESATDEKTEP